MIAFLVGVSNNLSFISETSSNHQTTIPTMSQESSVQGRKKARTGTVGNRATRANSHLPEYFTQPIDYSEMRSHLVCKTDPNAFSHFISIPMKEYRSFLANESLTPAEKEEFEAKNVWALKDMTRDQLFKLNTKLRRRTPDNKEEAISHLQLILEEENGSLGIQSSTEKETDARLAKGMVVFRFITAIFSGSYIGRLQEINNCKGHVDHETNNTYQGFFRDVSKNIQNDDAIEHSIIHPCSDSAFRDEYEAYLNPDALGKQDPKGIFTDQQKALAAPNLLMGYLSALIKTRNKMSEIMKKSETHCNDPFRYVNVAIAYLAPAEKAIITEAAAYYFYMMCYFNPDLSEGLNTSLAAEVRCSADDDIEIIDSSDHSGKKNRRTSRGRGDDDPFKDKLSSHFYIFNSHMSSMANHMASMEQHMASLRYYELERHLISDLSKCTDETSRTLILKSLERIQDSIEHVKTSSVENKSQGSFVQFPSVQEMIPPVPSLSVRPHVGSNQVSAKPPEDIHVETAIENVSPNLFAIKRNQVSTKPNQPTPSNIYGGVSAPFAPLTNIRPSFEHQPSKFAAVEVNFPEILYGPQSNAPCEISKILQESPMNDEDDDLYSSS
jgi:hypothetical protein